MKEEEGKREIKRMRSSSHRKNGVPCINLGHLITSSPTDGVLGPVLRLSAGLHTLNVNPIF